MALDAQIRRYARDRKQLHRIDPPTYAAGMSVFSSEAGLVLWLCEPARALDGKIPLTVMSTAAGRQRVTDVLVAVAWGNYL